MKLKQKISVIAFISLLTCGYAQTENVDIPELTPPSPSAYKLGEYGQENVGLFTGTAEVQVPLGSYKTRNLEVPVYLGYSSNGIKVDQIASNVGLDWNLVAGGVITRTARDKPDDQREYLFPEEEISEAGFFSPMAMDFFYEAGQDYIDTERDLFSFNFSGHSGKFVFDNKRKIIQIPKSDLKIEPILENGIAGFKITTPEGIEYVFLEEEMSTSRTSGAGHTEPGLLITTAWYLSRIEHPKGDIVNFIYENNNYSYVANESQSFIVPYPASQYPCGDFIGGPVIFPGNDIPLQTHVTHAGKRLLEINSNSYNSGKINFSSNINHPSLGFGLVNEISFKNASEQVIENISLNYLTTSNQRVFLEEILFSDPAKKYSFMYDDPEGFPLRLSKSQDHWGYFNGKVNSYWFPNPQTLGPNIPTVLSVHDMGADKTPDELFAKKGLLKKVTYPTKGATVFEYEQNTVRGTEIINSETASLNLFKETMDSEMGTYFDEEIVSIPMNQEVKISASAFFNSYACGPNLDVGKSKAEFSIQEMESGSYVLLYTLTDTGMRINLGQSHLVGPDSSDNFLAFLEEGKTYNFKLSVTFNCTSAGAVIDYYDQASQMVETNIPSGGLRVKSMATLDSYENQEGIKRYYYGKKESLGISSAEEGVRPFYLKESTERMNCGTSAGAYSDKTFLHLNSKSVRNLYKSSGSNSTYYEYITVSHGGENFENGGEEYQFLISNDYPGNPLHGNPIEGSPDTNFGWGNGLNKSKIIFKKGTEGQFIILENTENQYLKDERLYDEVTAYSVRKNFDFLITSDITYDCTQDDLTRKFVQNVCRADHSHWWNIVTGRCFASGANNEDLIILHPCFGVTLPKTIIYSDLIDNLDIQEYKSISYWYYLDATTKTVFDENGENPMTTVTKFTYGNPEHLQISKVETLDSENNVIIKELLYPDDIENYNSLGYNSLAASEFEAINGMKKGTGHIISVPIQTKEIKMEGAEIESEMVQRTNYYIQDGIVLPRNIATHKGEYDSTNNTIEARLTYKRYNPEGNPVEISKPDGPTTVFVWGFDGQFPIAKIENATYSEVASALNIEMAILDTYNELNLQALNNLRNNIQLRKSAITTYDYEPMVGVISITDPRENITTFHYDSFGRLEFLKDESGRILKEHLYNYKN